MPRFPTGPGGRRTIEEPRRDSVFHRAPAGLRWTGPSSIVHEQPNLALGYARIQTSSGAALPAGMAVFGYRQNGILVSEASAPAMPLISSGRIDALNTAFAIANPNAQAVTLNFYFTDSPAPSITAILSFRNNGITILQTAIPGVASGTALFQKRSCRTVPSYCFRTSP